MALSNLLLVTEQESLDRCEAIIARGVQTFIEVGEALAEIRDGRLYRVAHATFDDYCRDQWGIGRGRAYQLIGAATIGREMSTLVDNPPTNEREAREIAKVSRDQRVEALDRADELAGDQPRTVRHVQAAVTAIKETKQPTLSGEEQQHAKKIRSLLKGLSAWHESIQPDVIKDAYSHLHKIRGGAIRIALLREIEAAEQSMQAEIPDVVQMRTTRDQFQTDLDIALHAQLIAAGYHWELAKQTPDGRWHHLISARNHALLRNDQILMRIERLRALVEPKTGEPKKEEPRTENREPTKNHVSSFSPAEYDEWAEIDQILLDKATNAIRRNDTDVAETLLSQIVVKTAARDELLAKMASAAFVKLGDGHDPERQPKGEYPFWDDTALALNLVYEAVENRNRLDTIDTAMSLLVGLVAGRSDAIAKQAWWFFTRLMLDKEFGILGAPDPVLDAALLLKELAPLIHAMSADEQAALGTAIADVNIGWTFLEEEE